MTICIIDKCNLIFLKIDGCNCNSFSRTPVSYLSHVFELLCKLSFFPKNPKNHDILCSTLCILYDFSLIRYAYQMLLNFSQISPSFWRKPKKLRTQRNHSEGKLPFDLLQFISYYVWKCKINKVSRFINSKWISSMSLIFIRQMSYPEPTEVGVQNVPGHTQYLPPHLIKPKFWTEKNWFMY